MPRRPKQESFAQWVVRNHGWKALYPVVDFLVLWSMAAAKGDVAMTVEDVRRFGEQTHWGSSAKFYRDLRHWRKITGSESPAAVVEKMALSTNKAQAMGEVLGWRLSAVQLLLAPDG